MFSRCVPFHKFLSDSTRRSIQPPSKDSFFFRAFKQNEDIAKAVLKTEYIQQMKVGLLNPDYYGCLTVLDSYYCYRAADTLKSLLCEISKYEEPDLYTKVNELVIGYDSYNSVFLKYWHIHLSDDVVPTAEMKAYADFEHSVMCSKDPIYTLVAYIPCYYLWPWFSEQVIKENQKNHVNAGVYQSWFEGNYNNGEGYDSAYDLGNFIEQWQTNGKKFDESIAFEIYKTSMEHELEVFSKAYYTKENILNGGK